MQNSKVLSPSFSAVLFAGALILLGSAFTGCKPDLLYTGPRGYPSPIPLSVFHLDLGTPLSPKTGECIPVQARLLDASGNLTAAPSAIPIDWFVTGGASDLFSDSSCATSTSQAPIAAGQSSVQVYFKGIGLGARVLHASPSALLSFLVAPATVSITVVTPVSSLAWSGPASAILPQCVGLTVTAKDSALATVVVPANLSISLSDGSAGGAFYSDSACSSAVTALTLVTGQSSAQVWYTRSTPASVTLTASASGINSGTHPLVFSGQVPQIAYSGSSFIWSKNQVVSLTPVSSGGVIQNCVASSLPAGLSIDPLTCVISGVASQVTPAMAVNVTPSNTYGSGVVQSLTLTVNDIPPVIQFTGSPYVLTKDQSVTLTPLVSGGAIGSCGASGLPPGLSISSSTCVISGAPTLVSGPLSVTVTASNASAGSGTPAVISITVNDSAPGVIAYPQPSPTYTVGTLIAPQTPTVTGGGSIVSFSISPLTFQSDTGLSFDSTTGKISGTPNHVVNPARSFVVTAQNSGGSSQATLSVKINDIAANVVSYAGAPFSYMAGTPISAVTPVLSGGTPTSCTASPALPAGLVLDQATCALSGTPTSVAGLTTYTVTAQNSGGSGTSASLSLSVTAAAPSKLTLTGLSTYTTSTCVPYTVTVRDNWGNASNVTGSSRLVVVDDGVGDGVFYSDISCGNAISGGLTSISVGNSAITVYYRKPTPGIVTLTADSSSPTALAQGSKAGVNVTLSTPARIGWSGPVAPANLKSTDCTAFTVLSLDSSFNSVAATSPISVSLSAPSGNFYSNAACSSGLSTITIALGSQASAVFYYKRTALTSTAFNLTAQATAMASGVYTVNSLVVGNPSLLIFNSVPTSLPANYCYGPYTVTARDAVNVNNSFVSATTTVSLSSSAPADFDFYTTNTCATPLAGSSGSRQVTIASGAAVSGSFYVKKTSLLSGLVITAAATGLTSANQSINVSSGLPKNIAFTVTSTLAATVNSCQSFVVRVRDEANNAVNAASPNDPVVVNLSEAVPGGLFYGTSNCTGSPITSKSITGTLSPTGDTTFSFKRATVQLTGNSLIATAPALGTSGVTVTRAVVISSGTAKKLAVTAGPTSTTATPTGTTCLGPFTVRAQDENNLNITTAAGPYTLNLSEAPVTGGQFYSNSSCTTSVNSLTLPLGTGSVNYYYKTPLSATQTVSLTASAGVASGLPDAVRSLAIAAPALVPDELAMTVNPASPFTAGVSCPQLTLQTKRLGAAFNLSAATAVTLSGAGSNGDFYVDAGCTVSLPSSSATIKSGTSSVAVFLKRMDAGTSNLTATLASPAVTGNLSVVFGLTPPTVLSLSGAGLVAQTTGCGFYTVTTQDFAGNTRAVSGATVVSLSGAGAGGAFYSNASCTTLLSPSQISIGSGASSASFYLRRTQSGSSTVSASATGFTPGFIDVTFF